MGYGCTSSLVRDGIARGSSALVLLGNGLENELILAKQSAADYSFNKGSSPDVYPGSLMGSIALLRQTYYDADWYVKGGNKQEYNYALERMNLRGCLRCSKRKTNFLFCARKKWPTGWPVVYNKRGGRRIPDCRTTKSPRNKSNYSGGSS